MGLKCYLCDGDVDGEGKPFRIGSKDELICMECYTKTVNRRRALDEEKSA